MRAMKTPFRRCVVTGTFSRCSQRCLGSEEIFMRRRNRRWRTCLCALKSFSTREPRSTTMLSAFGQWTLHILKRNTWIACGLRSANCVKTTGRKSIFHVPTWPSIQFCARLFNTHCRQSFRRRIMKATFIRCLGQFIACSTTRIVQTGRFCPELIRLKDS